MSETAGKEISTAKKLGIYIATGTKIEFNN